MNTKTLLDSKFGSLAISVLLGLGLAALFRAVCKDGKCIVIKGPSSEDVNNFYYKLDGDCYKYAPVAAECHL